MEEGTIRHMVVFSLRYPVDAPETDHFLNEGKRLLSAIPTVQNFVVLRQISPKLNFDFGFSMEFADQSSYEAYNSHPDHQGFVERRWLKEVAAFQEIDFTLA